MDPNAIYGKSHEISLAALPLSLGELATAASILGFGGVLGLDEWFAGRSRDEISSLAEEAAQSLRERGLLDQHADGSLSLDPWLAMLVETAARAPRVLVLSVAHLSGDERRHIVHLGETMIVEQTDLDAQRQSLANVPDLDVLGEQLVEHLGTPERPAAPGPRFQVPASEMTEARALAQEPERCSETFQKAGLPPETAAALTAALQNDGAWGSASVMRRGESDGGETVQVTLESTQAWLSGQQGSWLVRSTGEQGEFLQLVPSSHAQILARIVQMLAGEN